MKNLMCYLFIKKTICLFSSIAAIIVVLTITYSCTKDNKAYNNEQQTVPEARASEKQFIVFDESGNNSVTLRVSSDDGTLLVNHNAESYELIINPEIPKEKTNCDSCNVVEDADFVDFNDRIKVTSVTIQLDIINVSFKDKVNNYALVSHGSSIVGEDEEEMEEEEMEAKFDFCRWFPLRSQGYEYYDVDVWGANKVKLTFKRTKKICNNIIYIVCVYNTENHLANCQLKHPGDEKTYGPYDEEGIHLFYKHYKNQTPTYTFYYFWQ